MRIKVVSSFLRILWIGTAMLTCIPVLAQRQRGKTEASRVGSTIVDDSTKNVYGPKSTQWTTEADLFKNRPNYRPLDTAVNEYARWTYVQRSNNLYQDLGVVGTAINQIFPTTPTQIGATSGFHSYSPYYNTQEPIYFDTKSPFSRFHLIWGGKGRALTTVEFSRNINPRWNFGFNYRPILVEKQILSSSNNDMMVTSHYYDFYTTFKSKNERYFLLFNFRRIRHQVYETGGVDIGNAPPNEIYDPNAKPVLQNTKTEEFRSSFHIYQHFQLVKPFQLYHMADFVNEENRFNSSDPKTSFDAVVVDSAKSSDLTKFATMRQEFGMKGNLGIVYYSTYYKLRTFKYTNAYLNGISLPIETNGNEQYLGLRVGIQLDSVTEFSGNAEYLFGGFHRIEGEIKSPWLDAYFRNSVSKPGFLQQAYRGSHDYWNQSFTGVNMTQAKAIFKVGQRAVRFKAGGTLTILDHNIFFKEVSPGPDGQRVLPIQSSGNQIILSPEVSASLRFFRHMYFRPQVIYTNVIRNDDNVIKLPFFFVNGQMAYENLLFKTRLQVQVGADFHWQSTYQALAYDVAIQSFYVQESGYYTSFPLVDLFFTGKMGRARFFFKYNNLIQAFTNVGYQPTPGYPGQRSVFDLGFDFLLFD